MTRYIQVHALTAYGPSNLNRDELGRPKTAFIGGTERLRISSQSLKRAWRVSDVFKSALASHLGARTKRIGEGFATRLKNAGVADADAKKWARQVSETFGKTDDDLFTGQLVHISPEEQRAVDALADLVAKRKSAPTEAELRFLRKEHQAADIAMFGRMLAEKAEFTVDAAVQVAHAFTVHPVSVEEDYFTAVDDLKPRADDRGAGHVGATEYGSGVFYQYVCVNRESLISNLGGDLALASKAIGALIEAIATVPPSGKQATFASRAYASYMLVEKTSGQPRSLSAAFLDGVKAPFLSNAARALEHQVDAFDQVYGRRDERMHFDVDRKLGSLSALQKFALE